MVLSAIVIQVTERVHDVGDLLAIASAEAQKRHGLKHERVTIKELVYVPRLAVYVALYGTPEVRGGRSKQQY